MLALPPVPAAQGTPDPPPHVSSAWPLIFVILVIVGLFETFFQWTLSSLAP
jgi:hypothetical protein